MRFAKSPAANKKSMTFMKQSKLSNFLQITDNGNIILPIDKYEFELSPKAAKNMVLALCGALHRLAERYPTSGIVPPIASPIDEEAFERNSHGATVRR